MLPLSTGSMQSMLRTVYEEMIELCQPMSSVACGLAGLGATLYIVYRVWSALGRNEPIDVFGLLRPFAIGIAIMLFNPLVIHGLNGVLHPIATATNSLVSGQNSELETALKDRQDLYKNPQLIDLDEYFDDDTDEADLITHTLDNKQAKKLMKKQKRAQRSWGIKNVMRKVVQWLLDLFHKAAVVVLDVIRTFFLIVLSILGPISFAISIFDGFQNTLTQWLARYISIYLWLPITDIYGAIIARFQTIILRQEIKGILQNGYYESENLLSFIFMIVAICGYFTIPTISNWIIQAGGIGSASRGLNMTALYVSNKTASYGGAATGSAVKSAGKFISAPFKK